MWNGILAILCSIIVEGEVGSDQFGVFVNLMLSLMMIIVSVGISWADQVTLLVRIVIASASSLSSTRLRRTGDSPSRRAGTLRGRGAPFWRCRVSSVGRQGVRS